MCTLGEAVESPSNHSLMITSYMIRILSELFVSSGTLIHRNRDLRQHGDDSLYIKYTARNIHHHP